MLLDPKPKSKGADLFSRGEELKELLSSLRDNPITVITGIRRVGKSSLMRVAIAETEQDSIMIDVRRIYSDSSGSIGKADLSYAIQGELEKKLRKERIKTLLSKVKGVSFHGKLCIPSMEFVCTLVRFWRSLTIIQSHLLSPSTGPVF
jgi:AAA+ ATPase superfamily predicted ATPase